MDAVALNKSLLDAIKPKLPKGVSMAQLLMETLNIGKEATYRRLRNEVPLTLYEMAIIAKKLNISLDAIIKKNLSENSIFELKTQKFYNLEERDYRMFAEYLETLKYAASESYSDQVFTSNIFPQFPAHKYYHLVKYNSFRWLYLNQGREEIKPFHEIYFPDYFFEISKDIVNETMNIKKTCYIWDNMIFQHYVKEIKYFANVQLIKDEDVKKIKGDLLIFLKYLEGIASTGKFETGNTIQIYISNINSDTSYSYLDTPHLHLSMISAFAPNYVVALDEKTLIRVKERIQYLKRVSTLISESGEIQRIQFFKEQYKLIDTL